MATRENGLPEGCAGSRGGGWAVFMIGPDAADYLVALDEEA